MTWSVSANPERFDEAMAWFESRVPIKAEDLATLSVAAQEQAFVLAGVNQLHVVTNVLDLMTTAVANGEPIDTFRKRAKASLEGNWTKATSARLDAIFITSTQTAYNDGRFRQMTDPDVMRLRPFWMFDAVLDSRTTEICTALNGLTLPANDPRWAGRSPPMHIRCRSGLRTQRRSTVERRGGPTKNEDIPHPAVPEGFGKLPTAAPFKPKAGDFPADAWAIYQTKQTELRASR